MDHWRRFLLVGAALAILTYASATPLSDAGEPKILTLFRSPRGVSAPDGTEDRLKTCLVQSGFANVHCTNDNGFVRCLSDGLGYTTTGNMVVDAHETSNFNLVRSRRGVSASERTEKRLRGCLVQSGFENVHCKIDRGVRCLSGGYDYTPTGYVIAMSLGVAIGIICVAAFGCYCWTRNGRRQGAAAAAHQAPGAPQAPTGRGSAAIRFVTPMASSNTIGSGFHRL